MPLATLRDILQKGAPVATHRPRPRMLLSGDGWQGVVGAIAEGAASLLALWADEHVHMAILVEGRLDVVSVAPIEGRFPSVGQRHAPALRLERRLRDLHGLDPQSCPDPRPWLDHGRWGLRHPLGAREPAEAAGAAYAFLAAEGAPLHEIPVGPVHAGIIEPGHFRFSANGELVVRLEERLGYVHKGIDSLMIGAPFERAARLAGRTSGDSTVAYAFAFCHALENALGLEVPRRALWLRALMAELERVANHIGDFGAICNDASFALMHAHCGVLRERVLRAATIAFGHRLMMDRIVPGGVAADIAQSGIAALRSLLVDLGRDFPPLVDLFETTTSLQDRTVGAGVLKLALAQAYACGGPIGRASGRRFDARRDLTYAPYHELRFEVPTRAEGDVDARVWLRIEEVRQSMAMIGQLLDGLPGGEIRAEPGSGDADAEGIAVVEGFRGDVLAHVRIAGGRVAHGHLRDPSWFQWPLLEAAIEGNIVADFPLCNKSFNCSYSGHDG
jgi:Ni,Fe-hydrogenase III large subunit